MNVLITVPSLDREFGGPALKARALAAALRARGHTVRLIGAGTADVAGAHVLAVRWRFHGTPLPRGLRQVHEAARWADVVHVIGYRDPVGTVAAFGARRAGVPYVLEPAGMHRRRLRSTALKAAFDVTLGRMVTNGAAGVVATSDLERDELRADGIPDRRIVVRANGIDAELLAPAPAGPALRARYGIPADAEVVLALGRIARKKNLPALARAVAGLAGAHLLVAGPDDRDTTLAELRRIGAAPSLRGRLHLEPAGLWGEDRRMAMADADLCVLWSASENFGTVPLEAAACGVPVVVSEQCGVAQWLGEGAAIVPLDGDATLREALRALLADGERRRRMGEAGRAAARTLTWDVLAAQQERIYAEVRA